MSGACYPDRLINSIPNLYYYAANNPSEATIAKRRSYAATISYLTPPAENAGLYKVCCVCWTDGGRGLVLRVFFWRCALLIFPQEGRVGKVDAAVPSTWRRYCLVRARSGVIGLTPFCQRLLKQQERNPQFLPEESHRVRARHHVRAATYGTYLCAIRFFLGTFESKGVLFGHTRQRC